MSNHDGSYLVNNILNLLDEYQFFKDLGKEKTLDFLKAIRKIGCGHDCNDGEILENIGESLGICYACWDYRNNIEEGLCEACRS